MGDTTAVSIKNYGEFKSSIDGDDDSAEIGLEEEVVTILGPEYAHLVQCVINKITSDSPWKLWQSEDGFSQCAGGVGSTPSSSSSQNSGNAPSSNTSVSTSSGGKRKSSGGGGGGGGGDRDDQANDDDGDKGHPPKRSKKPPSTPNLKPPKYDCPLSKRVIGTEDDPQFPKSRGCAPQGLEFRHVWDHMRKAHYGCETCGKRLADEKADRKHLMEKTENAAACQDNMPNGPPFEIGIKMFDKMEDIYRNKNLSNGEKWIQWWKMLHPDETGSPPVPLHSGIITLSIENIPTLQALVKDMWCKDHSLPNLTVSQMKSVQEIFGRAIQLCPTIDRRRRRRIQPQTPRMSAFSETPQPASQLAALWPPSSQERGDIVSEGWFRDIDETQPWNLDTLNNGPHGPEFSDNGNQPFTRSGEEWFDSSLAPNMYGLDKE